MERTTTCSEDLSGKSWPAIPFSAIRDKDKIERSAENPSAPPPPRLAVNGVTTSAPKSFAPSRLPPNGLTESEKRRRELEEQHGMHVPRSESSLGESPVIPLSPDPFGRFPSSTAELPQPVTIRSSVVVEKEVEHEMPLAVHTRARSGTTSRFSNDSLPGEDPVSKNSGRSALKSVRSLNLKGFWRRSKDKHGSSSAANESVPPPTPTLATSGKTLPAIPPHRPERPSEEQLDLPDIPENAIPRISQLIPHPQPQPQLRSSLDHSSGRRTPQDQLMPPPPSRPSLEQLRPPHSIPMYQGRNRHAGPVGAPMMQASRSASHLDRLHFDQESPYPTRLSSAPRPSSGRPSPPPPEPEKAVTPTTTTAPKSILKHKNGGQNGHVPSGSTYETPAATPHNFERPGGNTGGRTRRPSVINFGSTRGTATKEVLRNPQVPPQPMPGAAVTKASVSFKIVNPTTTTATGLPSPPAGQRQASFDSQGSRPSLDMTQFEFVAPKDIQRH